MNPGQEERDSAATGRGRHPVSLEPAASLYRDTCADPRPREVHPCPECPLGTAAPSSDHPPPRVGLAPLCCPRQMDWASEAHEGPAGLRGCGQRQELGCRPKGHKRRDQSSSVQRAGWTLVACALHLWGAGTHRLKGTPWSLPQPPALGAWCGGQPGMWRGGQAASGAHGALLGQRGTQEVRGFRAPMTGCPLKPKLNVCLFPASLSPAGSARICGEFRRGA